MDRPPDSLWKLRTTTRLFDRLGEPAERARRLARQEARE
jgi:hypothetical protein